MNNVLKSQEMRRRLKRMRKKEDEMREMIFSMALSISSEFHIVFVCGN